MEIGGERVNRGVLPIGVSCETSEPAMHKERDNGNESSDGSLVMVGQDKEGRGSRQGLG